LFVSADRVREVLRELWRTAREYADVGELAASQHVLDQLRPLARAEDGLLAEDLATLIDGLAVDTPRFGDLERERIAVADLGLLDRLDPRVTVVRRVRERLVRWPSWLPGDWFDDTRIEQVMVAPRFRHPMYEALDRYDRGWLLPGVGAIDPHEMVTLLSTNSRFVESFLIGLNHEMARELLWREYPTDGRATTFRSFWTTGDELLADVHALGPEHWATTSTHDWPAPPCCSCAASWCAGTPTSWRTLCRRSAPGVRPRSPTIRRPRCSACTWPPTCCSSGST
jgi:hypothetical protein